MIKKDKTIVFDVDSIETLIFLAKKVYSSDSEIVEDIPKLGSDNQKAVKTILDLSNESSFGIELYPTLEMKASYIFYSFIKNHPLLNGNKRMAVIVSTTFILVNLLSNLDEKNKGDASINVNQIDHNYFYQLALDIEATNPENYKSVLKDLEKEFESFASSIVIE